MSKNIHAVNIMFFPRILRLTFNPELPIEIFVPYGSLRHPHKRRGEAYSNAHPRRFTQKYRLNEHIMHATQALAPYPCHPIGRPQF
jgi:hypothetical protein